MTMTMEEMAAHVAMVRATLRDAIEHRENPDKRDLGLGLGLGTVELLWDWLKHATAYKEMSRTQDEDKPV